ncbi:MAG TPA: ATP-binding protein, partial [Burkholderiales bacterium]|nr:ATP-binding protein [Burkholderiales bacterium]
ELGLQWLGWGAGLLALALAGAWLIASNLARPLAALTRAAERIGRGEPHQQLAEEGPRELKTLAGAFNRMARDLESMERERAMVLAGISHDLRTPLSRMRLALEMSGAAKEEMRGDFDAMVADIGEIDAIIGQFLDFARGVNEDKKPQDLGALLDDIADHYTRLGKKIAIRKENIGPLAFARMAVRRAVSNLVDNALRHAAEPIEMELRKSASGVVIEVRDRGPGIPAAETERLKRPFTRLDAARSGRGGAGLGLAIVERVARAHGGGLELLPRDGGGLVARLALSH